MGGGSSCQLLFVFFFLMAWLGPTGCAQNEIAPRTSAELLAAGSERLDRSPRGFFEKFTNSRKHKRKEDGL